MKRGYLLPNHKAGLLEDIREFKQITTAGATTAGATTAAVTEKVWGEYVSVVCRILSLASKAKYKMKETSAKEFKIYFI